MKTPQQCPKCKKSLADPGVPSHMRDKADLFTLARSGTAWTPDQQQVLVWQCPYCEHVWPK